MRGLNTGMVESGEQSCLAVLTGGWVNAQMN